MPPFPLVPRLRPLHGFWYRRSVRTQLLIVFVVIDLVAAVVAGSVTILKARTSTRVEISASMQLAELLVSEAVHLMQQEVPAEQFLTELAIATALGAPCAHRREGYRRRSARGPSAAEQRCPARRGAHAGAGLVRGADRAAGRDVTKCR